MNENENTTDAKAMPPASLGSVQPVLYAVMQAESVLEYCRDEKEAAESASHFNGNVVPLYRSPTLTDAEREAVVQSADFADWDAEYFAADRNKSLADGAAQRAATLRGLLERHGGLPDREHPSRKEVATPARSGETGDDSPDRE